MSRKALDKSKILKVALGLGSLGVLATPAGWKESFGDKAMVSFLSSRLVPLWGGMATSVWSWGTWRHLFLKVASCFKV